MVGLEFQPFAFARFGSQAVKQGGEFLGVHGSGERPLSINPHLAGEQIVHEGFFQFQQGT